MTHVRAHVAGGARPGGGVPRRAAKIVSPKRTARSFLFSVLAVMALVLFCEAENTSALPDDSSPESILRILSPDYVYEHLLGVPRPPAKFVAVIMLDKDMPKAVPAAESQSAKFATVCQRRAYLGRLLSVLTPFRPKVVVLDMWFDPTTCSDTDSQALWAAVDGLSNQIPVVSGIGTFSPNEAESGWAAELAAATRRGAKLQPTELVAMPAIPVAHSSTQSITEGVVELNADNRKIPLSWPVYQSFATIGRSGEPRRLDSLAIAVVRAIDSENPTLKRVGALDATNAAKPSTVPHPYTTFLREEDLPIVRADDVLCASADSTKDCPPSSDGNLELKTLLSGRVILIGPGGFGNDVHQSLIGNVPGVVLQANYVESLLQNRVYVPMTFIGQILLLGAWIGVWVWVPTLVSSHRWKLAAHAAAIVLPILLLRLYIMCCKYYMPFLGPLLVGVAVFFVSRKIDEFVVQEEQDK